MADRSFGRKQLKAWLAIPGGSRDLTSVTTTIAPGNLTFTGPGTILRVRGDMWLAFSATTTALDQAEVTFGLALVSADAAVLGSTAVPDPGGDPDFPWLWWKSVSMFSTFVIDGTGSDNSGQLMLRIPVDTKAMRRFKPGTALAFVAQYGDTAGTPALRWHQGSMRVLIGT